MPDFHGEPWKKKLPRSSDVIWEVRLEDGAEDSFLDSAHRLICFQIHYYERQSTIFPQ